MARRETAAEQYAAIAAFYGSGLVEDLHDPRVPDFVLVHDARRAAHYALRAMRLFEKREGRTAGAPVGGIGTMRPYSTLQSQVA